MAETQNSIMQATLGAPAVGAAPRRALSSNNPYRRKADCDRLHQVDSDKQVVSVEVTGGSENSPIAVLANDRAVTGAENAPMVVDQELSASAPRIPEREADKEVLTSWQIQSVGENAPIPMEYQDSNLQNWDAGQHELDADKAGPPTYDSVQQASGIPPPRPIQPDTADSRSEELSPSISAIEPDGGQSSMPPRPEDRTAVGQLLSWIPSSIPSTAREKKLRLEKPVIVPQLDVPPLGESVPFQRCYSDDLQPFAVPMREFAAFLDGLAVAQAPSSALQGLKVFGVGTSRIPLPFVGLAGRGISALASSSAGYSSSRARLYLARANKEYFTPRGLHVSIVRDADIAVKIGMSPSSPTLAPLSRETLTSTVCDRRLAALSGHVAPLRHDMPDADKDTKAVERMLAKSLQSRMRSTTKDVAASREIQFRAGQGHVEAALQEEKLCRRLKWLMVETYDG